MKIVVGDRFLSRNGEIWTVTEDRRFGRGYWVVSRDRLCQTIFQRQALEGMTKIARAEN